jgi:hypothetical protein
VFDALLMPDSERTIAGPGLFEELARPDEFALLENVEISGSGACYLLIYQTCA